MPTMNSELKNLAVRLTNVRLQIIRELPFFGRLLLRLQFGFANCETAYTDQKRIVFDPQFASRLSDDELKFIMLHELFHCVLNNCSRVKGKIKGLYNIACDIVVNSIIINMFGLNELKVDGVSVMHLAPDKKEGREYSADEIYQMLVKLDKEEAEKYFDNEIDTHIVWEKNASSYYEEVWKNNIKSAANAGSIGALPLGIRRYIQDINHNAKCDWKTLLHNYIQFDRSDYTFFNPDKRFLGEDVIMPSFCENADGCVVKNLWAVVDTSGSISNVALTEALNEIYGAFTQVKLEGWASFFDMDISEPIPFKSPEDLNKIRPIGGGGTDFDIIFENAEHFFPDEPPQIIVIITDGLALFPSEESANGVPVIWTIIDSDVNPPWGNAVHITTE